MLTRLLRHPLVVAMIAIPVMFVAVTTIRAFQSGLTWSEMDLNRDGTTSFTELDYIADHGVRPVTVDGRACREVFAFKDGLPIKVICE